jgi:hypothetical protein
MKIENGYLVFENTDYIKNKKITATNMTALLGTNKFKKKGDALLSIFGIYKEIIDPFYTKRGEIAELILREKYKSDGFQIKFWDKFAINFDNFPTQKEFGGMIDIALISPTREVVECKSKNINDLEKTKRFRNDDYEHQAQFYGYFSKCDDINLCYVFFTDEQENRIRNNRPIDILKENFEFYTYKVKLDRKKFKSELEKCLEYKLKCYNEKKIPLDDISEKILQELHLK